MEKDSNIPMSPLQPTDTDWLRREIDRLDKHKADKLYVTQLEKNTDSELANAKLSFAKDVSSLRKDFDKLEKDMKEIPCSREEELAEMNATIENMNKAHAEYMESEKRRQEKYEESKKYWGRWVATGIVSVLLLIFGSGGSWVYSYYNIQSKTEEAQTTSLEVRELVSKLQTTQENQAAALNKLSEDTEKQTQEERALLRQDIKTSIMEVLQVKKGRDSHE